MELPYYIFLIIYFVIVFLFLVLTFFNVYHIVKFSLFDTRSKIVLTIYIVFVISIIAGTMIALRNINWFDTINLL